MAKLVAFEDFKAPWENPEGGEDSEIDKPRLKKYLHGILADKERLQGTVAERDTTIATITGERDALQAEKDKVARKDESEADRLKRENQELTEKLAEAGKTSVETLKLRVALKKGLTEVQAKRLVGSTEEELLADADELVASFGGNGQAPDEGEEQSLRRTPKTTINPGDPEPDAAPPVDLNNLDTLIPRAGVFSA